jgi:hypothetical protein
MCLYLPVRHVGYIPVMNIYLFICSSQRGLGCHYYLHILDAFAKLRKATSSFVVSLCLHEQLDSHWTDFQEISYSKIRPRRFKFD